jgi:hypothetical protein
MTRDGLMLDNKGPPAAVDASSTDTISKLRLAYLCEYRDTNINGGVLCMIQEL